MYNSDWDAERRSVAKYNMIKERIRMVKIELHGCMFPHVCLAESLQAIEA